MGVCGHMNDCVGHGRQAKCALVLGRRKEGQEGRWVRNFVYGREACGGGVFARNGVVRMREGMIKEEKSMTVKGEE